MVVKQVRGRRRYILFLVVFGSPITDDQLQAALRSIKVDLGDRALKLIQFDGFSGIVRVPGERLDRAIMLLNSVRLENGDLFTIRTMRASGTLRSLRE